ncbi:MAG: NAD-dependent epimerase/dehydratase family protein [Candidatus Omnitrophica bacterium]|nr:NAD-dependent epimerase/dehydratase family protein [Candidatus Omnitrophota bacterium]
MDTVIITGSAGLVGGEAVGFFANKGFRVIGIDNNMREYCFGKEGSTKWNRKRLAGEHRGYVHFNCDIRSERSVEKIFKKFSSDIKLVIHTAAQPSHDWAAREPITDFTINANGTLVLLEKTRQYCPKAVFIFVSTNKVYGDTPNSLPHVELEKRWELDKSHPYYEFGIDENMSIDRSTHSLFGVSKASADLLVQEYGRYFGMRTGCFRGGCLTGPTHSGAQLHGFLSYLVKCAVSGTEYNVIGYKGKQVRDNIHSYDLVNAFYTFYKDPRCGEVYNMGGGRKNNCSVLEAIGMCEKLTGEKMKWSYREKNRVGDHIWWISDTRKFKAHYPEWDYKYSLEDIFNEIYKFEVKRLIGK